MEIVPYCAEQMGIDSRKVLEKAKKKKAGKTTASFYLPEDLLKKFKALCEGEVWSAVVEVLITEYVESAENIKKKPRSG